MRPNRKQHSPSSTLESLGMDAGLQQDIAHFGSLANDCRLLKLQAHELVAQIGVKNRELHAFKLRLEKRLRRLGIDLEGALTAFAKTDSASARVVDPDSEEN